MDGFISEVLLYTDPYKTFSIKKHVDLSDMHTLWMILTVRKHLLSGSVLDSPHCGSWFCGSMTCSQTGQMEQ